MVNVRIVGDTICVKAEGSIEGIHETGNETENDVETLEGYIEFASRVDNKVVYQISRLGFFVYDRTIS